MASAVGALEVVLAEDADDAAMIETGFDEDAVEVGALVTKAAVVARRNCQPLIGMPTTSRPTVAVVDVLSQPESPPKLLANSNDCPSDMLEMH